MGRFFMDGHGWTLVFVVNFFSRLGWTLGWTAIANINHSHFWNNMLAEGLDRKASWIDAVLTVILGGRARVNEFKFHDLHHAFPNKVGALSICSITLTARPAGERGVGNIVPVVDSCRATNGMRCAGVASMRALLPTDLGGSEIQRGSSVAAARSQ